MKALEGRYNRATYWTAIGVMATLFAGISLVAKSPPHIREAVLIFLAVPRLHDIGKSGWLALWPLGLEIVGAIVGLAILPNEAFLAVMGFITLIILGLVVWLGCISGQPFANRFGEPPAAGIGFGRKSTVR